MKKILMLLLVLALVGITIAAVTPNKLYSGSGIFGLIFKGTSAQLDKVPGGVWTPAEGDMWYDTTGNMLNVYSGTAWISARSTLYGSVVVPVGTTYSVLAADSGKTLIVPDLTGSCTFTLPTPLAGLLYKFIYSGVAADAQDWIITSGSNTNFIKGGVVVHDVDDAGDSTKTIYPNGTTNSKVTVKTPAGGTVVELFSNGTLWYLNGSIITTTDAGAAFADQ